MANALSLIIEVVNRYVNRYMSNRWQCYLKLYIFWLQLCITPTYLTDLHCLTFNYWLREVTGSKENSATATIIVSYNILCHRQQVSGFQSLTKISHYAYSVKCIMAIAIVLYIKRLLPGGLTLLLFSIIEATTKVAVSEHNHYRVDKPLVHWTWEATSPGGSRNLRNLFRVEIVSTLNGAPMRLFVYKRQS